ncbi:MAG: signal peptidase I [Bacteroidetes bacterium]|nr:signal peptidase I [Bacteroidota bacterium]
MKKTKNSKENQWIKSLIYSILIATIIRWGTFENFKIPSSSMEGTLLTGDIVAVSKLHYGPRFPMTPLQIPLTHQKILGTNLKSYSSLIKLPYLRLFGFSKIKRGDKVVFNGPHELQYPTDLKTYYIKRCIGLPGDSLKIDEGKIYINDKLLDEPKTIFNSYNIKSNKKLDASFFEENKIDNYSHIGDRYMVFTTKCIADKISNYDFIDKIEKNIVPIEISIPGIFGNNNWNVDFYGPITIPQKGMEIEINSNNLDLYGEVIKFYEGNKNVEILEDKLLINNKALTKYVFKKNYYFMIGDNRHNSKDSRFTGFVPDDHILGKAVMVLFSIDKRSNKNIFKRIRWNRIFRIYK